MLTKVMVEAALNAEFEHHVDYQKHERSTGENSRNGYSRKRV